MKAISVREKPISMKVGVEMKNEHWEKVVENEIIFYLNYEKQYKREIEEQLLENEWNFQYPMTYVNEAEGRLYRTCPTTEQQAIQRIEVRESLNRLLDRAQERLKRLFHHFNELQAPEQKVLKLLYFTGGMSDYQIVSELGLQNRLEVEDAKISALRSLYRLYQEDRKDCENEFRNLLRESRQQASKCVTPTNKARVSALAVFDRLVLPAGLDRATFAKKVHIIPSTGKRKKLDKMTADELREVLRHELSKIS